MKLLGKKKELDELFNILEIIEGGDYSIQDNWEDVKKWLKDNCEWK